MFYNYLITAFRNLSRAKGFAFINISGLAIGMAFAMLIGLWIQYETSFDAFHKNKDRIALVLKNTLANGEKHTQEATPLPLPGELKSNYPVVKRAARVEWSSPHGLSVGDKKFKKIGRTVDPDFLEMFTFPVLKGNIKTALNDPYSIVLTESLAATLFGTSDPIGKMVRYDNEHDMQVTAVVQDVPKNSTITFDYLVPFSFIFEVYPFWKSNSISWEYDFMMTMVELKEGVTMEAFSKKIGPLNTLRNPKAQNQTLFLHPLKKWHLRNDYKNWVNAGGKIEYVQLFAVTGIFVLLIACFNFMNLATARSQKRAREVGVRKALGSQRLQLIMQFLTESIFIAFLAFLVSLLLVQLLLLLLKNIGFDNIYFDLTNISLIGSALLVTGITGLVAGSYPALYLSSFAPVKVLKGAFRQGKGAVNFRKVLVVSQFVISICLIIGTTIVFRQINHAKNRSIGYDKNNLVSIYTSGDLGENFNALKQDLLNSGYIESVAKASQPMTEIYGTESNFSWEGKDPNNHVALNVILTEWDFEKTVGLKFKQGRPFSRSYKTDSEAVLLNEAALKIIGYKDPLGKTIKIGDKVRTIVGIVEDVIVADPFKRPLPSAILFHSGLTDNVANIFLRLKPTTNVSKSMAAVDGIINKYNPSLPSEYSFVDEEFEKKFTTENQVAKLAGIFAGFAIFISCLGLIGLAAFMAERRTKEIGIRKVLGASVVSLWILLSKEFIWLVFSACLIASPLSLWLMNDWLQNYEYRINISWAVFAIASFLAIGIALFTVSTQVFKVALINPVKSLRRE